MMVYRVCYPATRPVEQQPTLADTEAYEPRWAGTFADCRALIRQQSPLERMGMLVEHIDIPDHKDALVDMLNGHIPDGAHVYRRWRGTSRGGLKEGNGL